MFIECSPDESTLFLVLLVLGGAGPLGAESCICFVGSFWVSSIQQKQIRHPAKPTFFQTECSQLSSRKHPSKTPSGLGVEMLDTCLTMLRVLPSTVPLRIAGSIPLSHSTGAAGATAVPVFLLPWWSRPISAATLSTVLNSGCCKCSISTGCLCFAFWLVDVWRPGVGSGCQILMPYTPEYHNPTVSTVESVELQMTMNHFEGV